MKSPIANRRIRKLTEDCFQFEFEGRAIIAWPGETVAAALLADGHYNLRAAEDGSPRGLLCGIGVCWECRCIVDGQSNSRACLVEVKPGMTVRRQRGLDN